MSTIPSSSSQLGFLNLLPKEGSGTFHHRDLVVADSPQASASHGDTKEVAMANRACIAGETQLKQPKRVAPVQPAEVNPQKPKLHRIGEVRVSQGISERTICRRLNMDLKQLRAIEDPTFDVTLSTLLRIREALEVPFADLLIESDNLSRPVQERAKLLKVMKTAVSIKESKLPPRASRLAEMLCEQLVELMPELAQVGGWPEFGSRRSNDSVARILAEEINTSQLRMD